MDFVANVIRCWELFETQCTNLNPAKVHRMITMHARPRQTDGRTDRETDGRTSWQ